MAATDDAARDPGPDGDGVERSPDAATSRPGSAARLVERAGATDRAARFAQRLAEVEERRDRRRARGRLLRLLLVVAAGGVGMLAVVVARAVSVRGAASVGQLALGAGVGLVVGLLGPVVRDRLAARRGASAWDWHRERHVLVGDPSLSVRDADRPTTDGPGRLPPPR